MAMYYVYITLNQARAIALLKKKNKARKKKLEQLLQLYGKKITKSVLPKIK